MRHSRTHFWLFVLMLLNIALGTRILIVNFAVGDKQAKLESVVQELVLTYRQEALARHNLALEKSDRHPENEEARAAIVEARRFIDLGDQLLVEGDAAGALPLYRSTGRLIEKMENQLKCGEPACSIE